MQTTTWRCHNCGREVADRIAACPRCGYDKAGLQVFAAASSRPRAAQDLSSWEGKRARIEPMQLLWWAIGLTVALSLFWGTVFSNSEDPGAVTRVLFALSLLAPTTMYSVAVIALGVRLGLGRR